MVRVFAGYDFVEDDVQRHDFAKYGYQKGVPMGGDLSIAPEGKVPSLLIRALRDADGANLDRIQIVKGWADRNGKAQEQIYNVAWSDNRTLDDAGKLALVGSTVDIATATWTNTIGSADLATVWQDPDFDPAVPAFYYARVIEIPRPRWTAYDAARFAVDIPDNVPMTTRERAYTSPIWYKPK